MTILEKVRCLSVLQLMDSELIEIYMQRVTYAFATYSEVVICRFRYPDVKRRQLNGASI